MTHVNFCFSEVSLDMTKKKGYHYVPDFSFFKLGIEAVSIYKLSMKHGVFLERIFKYAH